MIDWKKQEEIIKRRKKIIHKVKKILIDELMIDINPELISNDSPLIGRGLGLDSIDALELSISISTEFDITVNDSDIEMYGSVNKIADFIIEKQDEQLVVKGD
ncbi:phosphopantetheine-binding protein [Lactobacillus hominis]|uniref:phosphopantetheine-binding protein n=1 Tax=Lactobacillus hominis TaxID=1203033 RepID=UPI0026F20B9C|nr:phosphopantetheine-binding protein [Lactobacillus hominis]